MASYVAPLRDIRFALDHLADLDRTLALPAFADVDASAVTDALAEFGRFCAEVLAPLNRSGDLQPATLDPETGAVTTSPGFAHAYRQYAAAGWGSVPFDPAFGGGGFPWSVGIALQEMLTSSNMSFSLCPLLTQGAIDTLLHHGTEELRETFLRRMVAGEWTATMNLTEPDAGSDVGALRSRAVPSPEGDGTWRIFGQKIFITYGEHDMTENIVHLVLARTPGSPPGTKGISFFLVPKFLVGPDGAIGARNDVRCVSIEHKLGIKASPTCVMVYGDGGEGAVGHLVGEEHDGMRCMFTMMNNARLSVGLEGVAIAERAYQDALGYAGERRQGRARGAPAGESSPIIDHPDVRRMLLWMRAHIEAMRGLCYMNASALDMARNGVEAQARASGLELADLLTPLSKAWCTDVGVELTSVALQVFGGMGYVEETGVAQHFRDGRIAPIYEGTNGIQALDLVGRKLPMRGGAAVAELLARMESEADSPAELTAAIAAARDATQWCMEHATDPVAVMANATAYLRVLATTVAGWLMVRQSHVARRLMHGADDADRAYLEAKTVTARFFAEQVLPLVQGWAAEVKAGKQTIMALSADQFRSR